MYNCKKILSFQVPWAIYYEHTLLRDYKSGVTYTICFPKFPHNSETWFFIGAVFFTCYVVPLAFISFCYTLIGIKVCQRRVSGIRGSQTERNIQRAKIRIVRMLVVVAVVFACSWLPVYAIRIRILTQGRNKDPHEMKILNVIIPVAQWMGSANSCVNPFIYCYFSEQFRRDILAVLGKLKCFGARKESVNGTTLTKPAHV